jgi:hypothetical protein
MRALRLLAVENEKYNDNRLSHRAAPLSAGHKIGEFLHVKMALSQNSTHR